MNKKIRIAHISDVHIKDSRREEYNKILEKVYDKLREIENINVIAVTGDIFHDKTKASAHNFSDVESFLTNLTKIAQVVLIPGNHDLNIKIPGAPDLLSPVIVNHTILKEPNFIYWRNSGVYSAHGIIWVIIAPDGIQPSREEIDNFSIINNLEDSPRICLIHETVDGSLLFNGNSLRGKRLSPKDLIDYDAVLAGDIHLRQLIGGNKRAMYAGSLIQQNIGESYENHGFIIWEIELSKNNYPYKTLVPKIHEFNINSENGYLKIIIENGIDITKNPKPSKPNYYEIIYDEKTQEDKLNFYINYFTKLYGIPPRATRLIRKFQNDKKLSSQSLTQAQNDAQSLSAHEKIIIEILGENNQYLKNIINLHRNYYLNTINKERSRARVRLLNLKFSNIYCYGENNFIDFTKLENKISGVIAPNRAGKSALIDIIAFALYDEYPRADKKSNIVNEKYSQYNLSLEFEIDGKKGIIEKSGRLSKNFHSPECRLIYNNENLTQGTSSLTCKEIEKLVGNYEDAKLTSISHQGSSTDFVYLKPSERKKSLAQLLALGSFEKLEKTIKDEHSKLNFEIKVLEKNFRGKFSEEIIEEIEKLEILFLEEKIKIEKIEKEIEFKKQLIQSYKEKKEENSIKYFQNKEKLTNLNPEKATDLEDAKDKLKKIINLTSENEISEEEKISYSSIDKIDDNFEFNSKFKIPTRKELSDFTKEKSLFKSNLEEKERGLRIELNKLEIEKERISASIDEIIKNLKLNGSKLEINFEELKINIPKFDKNLQEEMPWPTYRKGRRIIKEEFLKSKEELKEFEDEKDNLLFKILQNLTNYSKIIKPIENEKNGEYESLKNSLENDQNLVLNKALLKEKIEDSKKSLKIAKLEEESHDKELLKIARLDKKEVDSSNSLFLNKELEKAKTKLLISEKYKNLSEKLEFKDDCYCCNKNKNLFLEEDLIFLKKNIEKISIEIIKISIQKNNKENENYKNLEINWNKLEEAEDRINRFNEINAKRKEISEYEIKSKEKKYWEIKKEALEKIEISTYWWIEDKENLKKYEFSLSKINEIKEFRRKQEDISNKISELKKSIENLNELKNETIKEENEKFYLRKNWVKKFILASKELELSEKYFREIKEINKLKEEVEKAEYIIKNCKEKIFEFENFLNNYSIERDIIIGSISSINDKIVQLKNSLDEELKRNEEIIKNQKEIEIISAYRKILDPKTGIADKLLKKSCSYLEEEVNLVLEECNTYFRVKINEDFELNTIFKAGEEEIIVSARLSSGYQKFVLSLAFRTALWKLAEVTLIDCNFIDEGFGSCDEENLESIIQYINSSSLSPHSPKINFIVSHIESMKNAIKEPLFIDITKLGSVVRN